jgi:hypothetical protein
VQTSAPHRIKGRPRAFWLCTWEESSYRRPVVDPTTIRVERLYIHLIVPEAPLATEGGPFHAGRSRLKFLHLCLMAANTFRTGLRCILWEAPHRLYQWSG